MPAKPQVQIDQADLDDPQHQQAILALIEMYANEPMSGSDGLSSTARARLISELSGWPLGHHFLAFLDGQAVGVAICFLGFSTFHAKPLLNIHDLAVHQDYRGQGVGRRLLSAVEEKARNLNCCKLTLEVRQDNQIAWGLYRKLGFGDLAAGDAPLVFMTKPLEGEAS